MQIWANSLTNKNMLSKIWTNGVQLSDWVENIVRKEEIARYEHFLLFPQCFQKLCFLMRQNEYLWCKRLILYQRTKFFTGQNHPIIYKQQNNAVKMISCYDRIQIQNIVGKGKNASYQIA